MKDNHCLYCYKRISEGDLNSPAGEMGFHSKCSKKIFGNEIPPELPYTEKDMYALAEKVIKRQSTITGVQPKLSLGIERKKNQQYPNRFTMVGLWGEYILKLQTEHYKHLAEIEDLTMHLAKLSKIKTVNHSLIRLKSGELAYITKRVDRYKGKKLHMEDMCQLTERLTEHKYKGSYEQIGKSILKFANNPVFDVINFFELVIFSFLTGNNDMHLKNFSLLKDLNLNYNLCPAYDLVASELVIEGDDEELALNLNGKKKKLKRNDFEDAMKRLQIEEKTIDNIFKKFSKSIPKWHDFIEISFIPEDMKVKYHKMINKKQTQLAIE